MEADWKDARTELLYTEGLRTLDQQQSVLESIHGRSGVLFGAAAIATSFLAGLALDGGKLDGWGWVATICFIGVGVFCTMILWPTGEWKFRSNTKKLARDYLDTEPPASIAEIHRDLALHVENWAEKNEKKLQKRFYFFQAASLLLGLEVFLWIIDLSRR